VIRIAFFEFLLFLAPFAIYAAYLYLVKQQRQAEGFWRDAPIFRLFLAGMGLIAIGMVAFATFSGNDKDSEYVPAVSRDGVIVPGHFQDVE
jgi:phosphoglycerol transferase MdoB-like AlkP superfamily enzyme